MIGFMWLVKDILLKFGVFRLLFFKGIVDFIENLEGILN